MHFEYSFFARRAKKDHSYDFRSPSVFDPLQVIFCPVRGKKSPARKIKYHAAAG